MPVELVRIPPPSWEQVRSEMVSMIRGRQLPRLLPRDSRGQLHVPLDHTIKNIDRAVRVAKKDCNSVGWDSPVQRHAAEIEFFGRGYPERRRHYWVFWHLVWMGYHKDHDFNWQGSFDRWRYIVDNWLDAPAGAPAEPTSAGDPGA